MDPLLSAEAELASKKKEAERQLDQQAAIIAQPATVLRDAEAKPMPHSIVTQREKCSEFPPGG